MAKGAALACIVCLLPASSCEGETDATPWAEAKRRFSPGNKCMILFFPLLLICHARLWRTLSLLVLSVAFLASAARGQSPEGDLAGTVEDSTGGRVPSARIVTQSEGSALRREVTSNARGEFRI